MDTQLAKSLKLLVIGDACTDRYYYGACKRLSPEAPVPVLKHLYTEERRGMCLNVGATLEALGATVDVIKNSEMIYKDRFVDVKTKQHLLRVDFGESEKIASFDASTLDLKGYDGVVVSDYNKGFIDHTTAEEISKVCHDLGIPLFVDSKKKDLACYDHAFIKINEKEHEEAHSYAENCEVITTLGSRGAEWRGTVYATQECEVFDVSGAGDTFLAAFVYQYLQGTDVPEALKFANHCARIVVQKFGTYCLQAEDLK